MKTDAGMRWMLGRCVENSVEACQSALQREGLRGLVPLGLQHGVPGQRA